MASIIEIETGTEYPEIITDRNAVIARIKAALKARSGKTWSVTGGRGTAYGWITIDAPPARRTATRDSETGGEYTTKADRSELAALLGLDSVHLQGVSIAASSDHYREYVDRAEGRTPRAIAQAYWD